MYYLVGSGLAKNGRKMKYLRKLTRTRSIGSGWNARLVDPGYGRCRCYGWLRTDSIILYHLSRLNGPVVAVFPRDDKFSL